MKIATMVILSDKERLATVKSIEVKYPVYSYDTGKLVSYVLKLNNQARVAIDSETGEIVDCDSNATDIDTQLSAIADTTQDYIRR